MHYKQKISYQDKIKTYTELLKSAINSKLDRMDTKRMCQQKV